MKHVYLFRIRYASSVIRQDRPLVYNDSIWVGTRTQNKMHERDIPNTFIFKTNNNGMRLFAIFIQSYIITAHSG